MTAPSQPIGGPVVEEQIHLTLVELCRASRVPESQLRSWVGEGAIEPIGSLAEDWRFAGGALRRARLAARLARDFELNAPGVALALDLLDEIEELRARLRRLSGGGR
jgi:chaperone modulatory protein CbpM